MYYAVFSYLAVSSSLVNLSNVLLQCRLCLLLLVLGESRHLSTNCVSIETEVSRHVRSFIYRSPASGRSLAAALKVKMTAIVMEVSHRHESAVMYMRKDCLQTVFVISTKSPT